MSKRPADEITPTVSIPQEGYDKPRHPSKSAHSKGDSGPTNPATIPARASESPDVETHAGRKLPLIGTQTWLAVCTVIWTLVLAALAHAHVPGCHTTACDKRIHEKRRQHWKRTHLWEWRFHHLSAHERAWTRCISFHESGNRRVARESAHWSYFQWALSTWHAAGGAGNPENVAWFEQAVRAVWWAHRAGSSQWTTSERCGSA